jgi:ribonuclease R
MKKKQKGEKLKTSVQDLQQLVLKYHNEHPDRKFTARQLIRNLQLGNNKDSVNYAIEQLISKGLLPADYEPTLVRAEKKLERAENKKAVIEAGGGKKPNSIPNQNPNAKPNPNQNPNAKQNQNPNAKQNQSPNAKENPNQREKTKWEDKPKNRDKQRSTYEGIVDMTRSGAAYIKCQGLKTDIYISPNRMNGAFHGDRVAVTGYGDPERGQRVEGEITKILERATEHFVGRVYQQGRYRVVLPDREGMPAIYLSQDPEAQILSQEAQTGEKVVVKIIHWQSPRREFPEGVITAILGKPGSNDMEMKSILINNGFNIEFPEAVLKEAKAIDTTISAAEIAKRRDMRKVPTLTIDPSDAKDFDDALSIQQLENGDWEVGVHIADVTHYLLPDTELDKEAYWRSTSVYLVDRCCPMLPENLSNGVCSLRPNEDKLTFSAVFTFDDAFKLKKEWFGKTVTHSIRRFSYEEAQEVLETGKGDMANELNVLNQIGLKLRKARFRKGAINFETEEVRFRLDENGVPLEVYIKERKDSNMLIEDFMLLANKEVATYIAKKEAIEIPFVYRIHDTPDPSKLADFASFARELGINLILDTPKNIAKSLNDLMKQSEKNDAVKLLTPLAIRCMAKAEYSTNNIGHYGLAFEKYGHFTSPIRRYSDVLAHRILADNLDKKKTIRVNKELLEARCNRISKQERKAAEAERESVKYKQVEFIKNHIGEEFEGIISGMMDRGLFIELKGLKCEGMVPFNEMEEPFQVEPSRLKAKGVISGKILRPGDTVRVRVLRADLDKRQIELQWVPIETVVLPVEKPKTPRKPRTPKALSTDATVQAAPKRIRKLKPKE